MERYLVLMFGFFATLVVCQGAGLCWLRRLSDETCSGFLRTYNDEKDCCGNGGIAFSNGGSRRRIFFHIFVQRPSCKLCNSKYNPCASIKCEQGWTCKVSSKGVPGCKCQPDCSQFGKGPVCGSGGRTYASECHLRKSSCRQNRVEVEYRGPCRKHCSQVQCGKQQVCATDRNGNSYCIDTRCPSTCPSTVSRVCGTNHQTYTNQCLLKKASCSNGRKFSVAYLGPCRAKASCQDVRCPRTTRCVFDVTKQPRCQDCGCALSQPGLPVCGSDGKKYKSWCYMRRHSCLTGKMIRVNPLAKC